jgi:hypothetical protein
VNCVPLTLRESANLARNVCRRLGTSDGTVGNICRTHTPDMNAVLANLRMLPPLTTETCVRDPGTIKDSRPKGFFEAAGAMLRPTHLTVDAYRTIWSTCDRRVEQCFENSYLPALVDRRLTASVTIASTLSLLDSCRANTSNGGIGQESTVMKYYATGVYYQTLYNSTLNTDAKPRVIVNEHARTLTATQRSALGACMMDHRKREVVSYLILMQNSEHAKAVDDANYTASRNYQVRGYIAGYATYYGADGEQITLDLWDAHQGKNDTDDGKRTRTQENTFLLTHPATQATEVLARRLSSF